jgi:hypothetical protein
MDCISDFSSIIKRVIHEELKKINPQFKDDIMMVLSNRGFDQNVIPMDLTLYYPFWVSYNFEIPMKENIAKELLKYYVWFEFHVLIQDDLVDQKALGKNFYKQVIFSDYFLLKSLLQLEEIKRNHSLISLNDVFYTYEIYINSILTEKSHADVALYCFSENDFNIVGKKFAPLILTNILFSRLAGSDKYLNNLNSFLENIHVCIQIVDDMNDWKDDLKNQYYTYFLTEIIREHNIAKETENIEEFEKVIYFSDVTRKTAEKGLEYLNRAKNCIQYMENPYLNEYIKLYEKRIKSIISNREQRIKSLINSVSSILEC